MKNNRRINLDLIASEIKNLPRTSPSPNSLFWKLWKASEEIAQKALNTKFVQAIKNGTLDPVAYGGFNVNDAYYCFHGAEDYSLAAQKAKDPLLKAYLNAKHKSYVKYNQSLPKTWHIKDATGVVPNEACKAYSDFERKIATEEEAIYCLIVMLPCEYLWAWLGAELAPPKKGNLYADWITGNNDPHGAYAMGNFLEDYGSRFKIDEEKALKIYQQAMTHEWKNFEAAL